MALRISAVAVCCSRDSVRARLRTCSSWNRRTFSIAITAWSAKVSSSATCWSVKGRASVRNAVMAPIATPSRSSGTPTVAAMPWRRMAGAMSGYSASRLTRRSSIRSVWRSRATRPDTEPRVSGLASPVSRLDLTGPWRATSRIISPSIWKICAFWASHRRAALSTTAAITGWISVGELLMTPRICAVAVCCSRASLSSWVRSSTLRSRPA